MVKEKLDKLIDQMARNAVSHFADLVEITDGDPDAMVRDLKVVYEKVTAHCTKNDLYHKSRRGLIDTAIEENLFGAAKEYYDFEDEDSRRVVKIYQYRILRKIAEDTLGVKS